MANYFSHPELLEPPLARAAYSDRTAWLLAQMSAAAYIKPEADLRKALAVAGFTLVKTFDNQGTQAFLAKREKDMMAVLAFRGTEVTEFKDILADFNAKLEKNDAGTAHQGFLTAYNAVSDSISAALLEVKGYALYITGHSLGGALATVALRVLNEDLVRDNLAACYTFGSPRVGKGDFDPTLKAPLYRIVHSCDAVPCVPPTAVGLGFVAAGVSVASVFLKQPNLWKSFWSMASKVWGYRHQSSASYFIISGRKNISLSSPFARWFVFFMLFDKGVKDHSIDLYSESLAAIADARIAGGCAYAAAPKVPAETSLV